MDSGQWSPGGDWFWDGSVWLCAITADGRWRYDGRSWSPYSGPPAGPMPAPPAGASPQHPPPAAPGIMETALSMVRLYLHHLPKFLAVAAVAVLPLGLVLVASDLGFGVSAQLGKAATQPASGPPPDPTPLLLALAAMLAANFVAVLILFPLGLGALVAAAASAVAQQPVRVGPSYRSALHHYRSLLAVVATATALPILWVGFCVGLAILLNSPIIAIGLLPLFIAARLFLSPQAVVIEGAGPLQAVRRAWQVTVGRMRFLPLILIVLGGVVVVPVLIAAGLPVGAGIDLATELHLGEVLGALAGVVMAPLAAIGTTVVYSRWMAYPPRPGSW